MFHPLPWSKHVAPIVDGGGHRTRHAGRRTEVGRQGVPVATLVERQSQGWTCAPQCADHDGMGLEPGDVVSVIDGPFVGYEVEVIEELKNNLVAAVVTLLDGPARLELSLLDLDAGNAGPSSGVREPRRPLLPHTAGAVGLRPPVE